MLYFKLNALNCDPLGEDRRTPEFARRTQAALELDDGQLARLVPMVGRRVDFIHRLYNRDWREIIGVVLWGEKHFTIDEDELAMLRAMDGRRTVGDVAAVTGAGGTNGDSALSKVRRLARRGVIDLLQVT
jgi:hypothetical protein